MVQVLEKEEIYILIPEIEEVAEKVEEKPKKVKRKLKLGKYAKQHQGRIDINKMKNKVDANIYRASLYPR
jgi:hypothetical protein